MAAPVYAQVRGSVIRLTRLNNDGSASAGASKTLVSRNITRITVNEETSARPGIEERGWHDEGLRLSAPAQDEVTHYVSEIQFMLTDPGAIELVTGQPVITDSLGKVIGFQSQVRRAPVSFALEIWSRLATPVDGYGYGYTLIPHLRGGIVSGLEVSDASLVSFTVRGATTRPNSRWGRGPYTLYDPLGTGGWDGEPVPLGWDDLPWDTAIWGASPQCGPESASTDTHLPFSVGPRMVYANLLTQGAPAPTEGAQTLTPVSIP